MRIQSLFFCLALVALGAGRGAAVTLEIHNPAGAVSVSIDPEARVRVQGRGATRPANQEDIKISRQGSRTIVRCQPADGERIDLDVQLPIGFLLDVTTEHGAIEVTGLVRRADLRTETGSIRLAAPWLATRIQLDAEVEPAKVILPEGLKFSRNKLAVTESREIWRLRDKLPERHVTYGGFQIKAGSPGEVRLVDVPIPRNSPVKMHWQAPGILDDILRGSPPPAAPEETTGKPAPAFENETGAVFRSDVRMVNLVVAVTNERGEPATDLASEDFEVVEDGVPQDVTFAGSDSVPFNLSILLDLSGSTKPDRASMIAAAKRFVSLAGERDRIAVYALAADTFHVISNLTSDSEALLETIERLPYVSGASPLYDSIVLAYAEDLLQHPGERNALIVISDGIDNQVSRQEAPSRVKFKHLVKAAEEMHALVYPVFLLSGERFGRNWSAKARKRLQQLADASGGRLFPAESVQDLQPVFPLVEAELRSVYSVAYYPQNQDFDGGWRHVEIKIKRPRMKVRARTGYYAR